MRTRMKALMLVLILLIPLILTGCEGNIEDYLHPDTRVEWNSRRSENLKYLEQMRDCGVISGSDYDTMVKYFKDFDELMDDFFNDQKASKIKESQFKAAISAVNHSTNIGGYSTVQSVNKNGDIFDNKKGPTSLSGNTYYNNVTQEVVPYMLSSDIEAEVYDNMDIKIYVAKYASTQNGIDALSKAIAEIKGAYEKDKSSSKVNELINQYFDKTDVDLFTPKDGENKIFRATKANRSADAKNGFGKDFILWEGLNVDGEYRKVGAMQLRFMEVNKDYVDIVVNSDCYNSKDGGFVLIGNKALLVSYPISYIKSIYQDGAVFKPEYANSNMLLNLATGEILKYSGDGDITTDGTDGDTSKKSEPVMKGVINKSNRRLIATEDQVNVLLGNAKSTSQDLQDIYDIITDLGGQTSTTASVTNIANLAGNLESTGYNINDGINPFIQTVYAANDSNDQTSNTPQTYNGHRVVTEDKKSNLEAAQDYLKSIRDGQGYKMPGAELFNSSSKMSNTSFMMLPEKHDFQYSLPAGDQRAEFTASVGTIVLKDYLELTPTPGYSKGTYTPLGRMIRFNEEVLRNGGTEYTTWAYYIDNSGSNMFPNKQDSSQTTIPIMLSDIVGIDSSVKQMTKLKLNADGTETTGSFYTEESLSEKIGDPGAEIVYKNSMPVSALFPGDCVEASSVDAKSMYKSDIPVFYCVKVVKGTYDTGLFSTWIESSNTSTHGLVWWNTWLKSNGYDFTIDINELVNGMNTDLEYDRSDDGMVKLDLGILEKIQRDIDEETTTRTLGFIRTLFAVLGYILIMYSMLIPCAWLFDTNIPQGPKLLTMISFGNWVAVPEIDDYALMGSMKKIHYVTLKDALVSGIIVLGVGIFFVAFDVIKIIVTFVVNGVSLTKWLQSIIFR